MKKRLQHIITGQVQGVGFRPFIFRLAHTHKLIGFVSNTPLGVIIEVEGSHEQLSAFNVALDKTLPPLAKISSHIITEIPLANNENSAPTNLSKKQSAEISANFVEKQENEESSFIIKHTKTGTHDGHNVLISPDVATCKDCQNDIFTKGNYRYAYPFTNCTNCGPRYTIIHSIPYDRPYTSMACFPLCPTCKEEYENPHNRRFHAQPNACLTCGPKLWLTDAQTALMPKIIATDILNTQETAHSSLPHVHSFDKDFDTKTLSKCIQLLGQGKIIAIKALGGFQLTCNAYDESTIHTLRIRKNRPHKAFALMVANIENAKKIAHITCAAEELLCSAAAPIVLCPKKDINLPQNIAPDTNRIGIMLAYTPLHKILFSPELTMGNDSSFFPKALIMTSANAGGEPICIKNRHAAESLKDITDYYLFHNRDILVRVDDSVCLALGNVMPHAIPAEKQRQKIRSQEYHLPKHQSEPQSDTNQTQTPLASTLFFRRARGYAPSPIYLPKIINNFNYLERDAPTMSGAVKLAKENAINTAIQEGKSNCTEEITTSAILSSKVNKTGEANKIGEIGKIGEISEANKTTKQHIHSVLATGAFLKSTFCLTRNNEAFVSQHIGDLDNCAVTEFYEETLTHLQKLLEIKPDAVVCDLHPDFPSTHFAQNYATQHNIPLMHLAHHYAHAYAVLAEYNEYDLSPSLALILDGTGQGSDNTSWGGELLYIAPKTGLMLRLGRIQPMILAGGEIAIKEPWRIAQAMYEKCLQKKYLSPDFPKQLPFPWLENEQCAKISPMLSTMLEKNIQCMESSGCGRLFDAISALLGLCYVTSYEGQAAIRLESAQFLQTVQNGQFMENGKSMQAVQTMKPVQSMQSMQAEPRIQNTKNNTKSKGATQATVYNCPIHEDIEMKNIKTVQIHSMTTNPHTKTHINDNSQNNNTQNDAVHNDAKPIWNLDTYALFAHIAQERANRKPIHEIAQNFHQILSHSLCNMAEKGMQVTGITNIVLSGGVMNNETLLSSMHASLSNAGFNVLTPKDMPSGDGAISLGQAFYGILELQRMMENK